MVTYLHIRASSDFTSCGRLHLGHSVFACLIGKSGRAWRKREGDGKSPIGAWTLRSGHFRADRMRRAAGGPHLSILRKDMGWCEVPTSGLYNRAVRLPFRDGHETMWRKDSAYDVVFPTDHNERPRIKGFGSAIFFHLIRDGAGFTEGCIAVSAGDMRKILSRCGRNVRLAVWPSQGQLAVARRKWHCPPARG